ncbi:uncharacterized protein PFL1_04419 [Pseudozyma flocculosa PF-1]|uniref:Mitochondrial inner membrane protease ATP23 n=2 Tax=Pseudozyma flocculosa TaxID=84751 RepID=A0A5C3FC87_9BASI|nr:uncharacterized protein PFL1_04419 [Pseudozyma flocculosa PF-1]EPQ28092.1 hypothetical protein PFL1_04419 [Pseudozyma flocculosa PF-1]SPO41890.1 probable Mitochondrial inner membrane protease ATP23 [Pseudozyma flocculosa]
MLPTPPSEETRDETVARERVEQWTNELFRTSPMIRFMSKHLALLSCDPRAAPPSTYVPPSATSSPSSSPTPILAAAGTQTASPSPSAPTPPPPILIATCPKAVAGGFSPSLPGEPTSFSSILLCSNRLYSKEHVENTISHEMIHWFDHCRFKVRWDNLAHHACSEIRAATLSGDCDLLREWGRREYGLKGQFQKCIKRRAALSVAANPSCQGDLERAKREVDLVFDSCFKDTRPFDEIY